MWSIFIITICELPVLIKRMFFYRYCQTDNDLVGKTVVLTGGTSGIGRSVLLDFYKRGGKIIVPSLTRNEFEETVVYIKNSTQGENIIKGGSLCYVPLDLSSMKSVKNCAESIKKTENKIDILVNNAAVLATAKKMTEDGFDHQISVNYYGHVLLTLLLLPLIVKSGSARILNVTSTVHKYAKRISFDNLNYKKMSDDRLLVYCVSKLAMLLFGVELSNRLQDAGIRGVNIYNIHPGDCFTNIGKRKVQSFTDLIADICYYIGYLILQTVEYGAQTIIYCALSDNCARQTGLYYSDCGIVEPSEGAQNLKDAEKLWNYTINVLKSKVPELNFDKTNFSNYNYIYSTKNVF